MNANHLFDTVMQLDLEPIKTKLMHVPSGEGWSRAQADAVEKEYRRFLCLMKSHPGESIAPLVDVDTFWHYHILDTMKYAADCAQAFGYFLHHYPYVGMRGGNDAQFRIDSGARTRVLYEAAFGEAYPSANLAEPAFCAGPEGAVAATAFCAGPENRKAAGVTFCAGPENRKADNVAFCAGPENRKAADVAFCAGPENRKAGNVAFCAGPEAATAFCAGPENAHTDRHRVAA